MLREQISQSGRFGLRVTQRMGSMGFFCRFGRTRSPSERALAFVATGRSLMDVDGMSIRSA
eukprot:9182201-Pyramimonas_sp.AAC.1